MKFQVALSTIALLAAPVTAWPTGAGACPKGMPAVFGSHLREDKNIIAGSLEDAPQGIQVQFNGRPIQDGVLVAAGEVTNVTLMSDAPFTGFLIRFGHNEEEDPASMMTRAGGYLSMALEPGKDDTFVKTEENYCEAEGVSGITHTGKEEKTTVTATLEAPQALEYIMDVTVVIANNAETSEYYHTSYLVQATNEPLNLLAPWITPPATTYQYQQDNNSSKATDLDLEEDESVVEGVEEMPMVSGTSAVAASGLLTFSSVAVFASFFL